MMDKDPCWQTVEHGIDHSVASKFQDSLLGWGPVITPNPFIQYDFHSSISQMLLLTCISLDDFHPSRRTIVPIFISINFFSNFFPSFFSLSFNGYKFDSISKNYS
jgi:hypothetical protein